jgi:hypothetical protein
MTRFTPPAGVPAIEFQGVEKRFAARGGSSEVLAARDVTLDQVLAELERREGVSGIAEKAGR